MRTGNELARMLHGAIPALAGRNAESIGVGAISRGIADAPTQLCTAYC